MPTSITIHAGRHPRVLCPVEAPWPDDDAPDALQADGRTVPVQRIDGRLAFVLPELAAGTSLTLRPAPGAGPAERVTLADTGAGIDVRLPDGLLTTYRYADNPARPCFYPVLAPGGVPVTRHWPIRTDVPGETSDHPHQRSMWIAYGDVNGTDNWSHEENHGYTKHLSIDALLSGPVFGRFRTSSRWTDARGAALLDQDLTLTACAGPVTLGDTKEGGMISVRVASSMDVDRGGRIENAYGGIDEAETWGKAAHWCDYAGEVDGKRVGVAIMDHPDSFRYPTYWHVRNYGLMAANPFALSEYTGGVKNGTHRIEAGASIRFRYRILLHAGDAQQADVRSAYLSFVSPPRVEVN
jgi:hypothetical protein